MFSSYRKPVIEDTKIIEPKAPAKEPETQEIDVEILDVDAKDQKEVK